jgi:hypothetical protein
VHGFEVNLIIEYCDFGCLRDALDAGAFFSYGAEAVRGAVCVCVCLYVCVCPVCVNPVCVCLCCGHANVCPEVRCRHHTHHTAHTAHAPQPPSTTPSLHTHTHPAGALNYAAILDTAADVAKAMLHLHCNQVRRRWWWW